MTTYAERLACFAVSMGGSPDRLPGDVRQRAAERVLDNIGCMVFGTTVAPAMAAVGLVVGMGAGDCRVLGAGRTSPTASAFAHGTLAQSFELNDLGVYVHPGACVIPACLTSLDMAPHPVSGERLIAAVVAGYEATVRISECVGPSAELTVGWHTPAFHGAIGAAIAAGVVMDLDPDTLAHAIAIAADLAGGGLMMARLGTDVKRLHCGRAAETGLLAVLLAQRRTRSRLDTLEHAEWGYCRTMTAGRGAFDLDEIDRDLGHRFVAFDRTAIKYYPVGAEVLGAIDNVNRLRVEHGIGPDDVVEIIVGTPKFFHGAEGHVFPRSLSEVHFNIEYGIAMALSFDVRPVHEDPGVLQQWRTGFENAQVRDLAARVRHVVDAELDLHNPYGIDSRLAIRLRDGSVLRAQTEYVTRAESPGTMHFSRMGEEQITRKFLALTSHAWSAQRGHDIARSVRALGAVADARTWWRALDQEDQG